MNLVFHELCNTNDYFFFSISDTSSEITRIICVHTKLLSSLSYRNIQLFIDFAEIYMAEDIKKIVFVDLARFIEEHNDVFVDFARFIEEHNEPKAELSLRTAVETYRILKSLKADYETGTSRNTVQAMASLGSSVAGNYAGD